MLRKPSARAYDKREEKKTEMLEKEKIKHKNRTYQTWNNSKKNENHISYQNIQLFT
jgi:hypothetical protein